MNNKNGLLHCNSLSALSFLSSRYLYILFYLSIQIWFFYHKVLCCSRHSTVKNNNSKDCPNGGPLASSSPNNKNASLA